MENNRKEGLRMIFAAGGLVWRKTSSGPEVAVIHRSRYGDWCLPKGKPKEGESWENTALREVREETGCDAKITGFAGTTNYQVKETPKIVFFYNMSLEGECSFQPSEEVDKVVWLSPREVIKRLDYIEERNLLSRAYFGRKPSSRFKRFTWFKSIRYHRLAGSLNAYRHELEHRICMTKKIDQEDPCWVKTGRKLLSDVEFLLFEGNIDEAWKSFHAAQRMEIFGLTNEELKVKVAVLRQEAEKLSSWRKKATDDLIGDVDCPKENTDYESVYQAALLRDENYHNQAFKDGLLRTHILTQVWILAGIILLLLYLSWIDFIPLTKDTVSFGWRILVSVALFGLLGGTLSAMLSIPATTKSSRIPELTHTIRLTLLRLFMGAGSALVIYLFLNSQLKEIVYKLKEIEPYTVYAISIVAGFSERLVLRAVEFVTKEKKDKG
jgi:8-oxo-dGTP diphosphatase